MPEAPEVGPGHLLLSRRFLPLFLVQALGAFNDNVFKNAFVALMAYRLAAELQAQIGVDLKTFAAITGGLFILPFALFSPFAGQISDRVDKAIMMRFVKFSEIVLMIGAAVAYHVQAVMPLLILLFLMGAQSAFFAPIKYGALPFYLRRDELVSGNGLIQAATFFAILLGTIIGTNLILSEAGILWVSIAVILIAIIGFVASLFAPSVPPSGQAGTIDWLLIPAMVKVWRRTRAVPRAYLAIWAIAWFWFAGSTFVIPLSDFAKNTVHGDETVLTLLLAGFSIGVAIGAMLSSLVYRGQIRIGPAPWGAIAMALFTTDLWFAVQDFPHAETGFWSWTSFATMLPGLRVVFDFVALAAAGGFYLTPLNAVYQDAAPEAERGRVVACSNMIDALLMSFSAVFVIALGAAGFSLPDILLIAALTGLPVALLLAWIDGTGFLGRTMRKIVP
ncbi:MAG: MFS transporter [Neomegalonema sp.]|nr:MFS transporter [Neomegalonema sp.]